MRAFMIGLLFQFPLLLIGWFVVWGLRVFNVIPWDATDDQAVFLVVVTLVSLLAFLLALGSIEDEA